MSLHSAAAFITSPSLIHSPTVVAKSSATCRWLSPLPQCGMLHPFENSMTAKFQCDSPQRC
jgi:hypothetical protein